jgi:hypothetical protein
MSTFGLAPPGSSGRGGALDYTTRFLGGLVNEVESFPFVGSIVTNFLPFNADRVGLLLVNLGGGPLYISINSGVSQASGILLVSNGGSLSLNVTEDFTLTSRSFWAVAPSVNVTIYVLEIIRILQPTQVPLS